MARRSTGNAMKGITEWLASIGLSEYAQRFADNAIDLSVIRDALPARVGPGHASMRSRRVRLPRAPRNRRTRARWPRRFDRSPSPAPGGRAAPSESCLCGVPGGTPEARLGGGPHHADRHSLGDSRCRVHTAIREGARRAAARTRCLDKHALGPRRVMALAGLVQKMTLHE